MDLLAPLDQFIDHVISDERFAANLIGLGAILGVIMVAWLALRRLLAGGLGQLACATGYQWLDSFVQFATRQVQAVLGWLTLAATAGAFILASGYHLAGGHLQRDLTRWYDRLTLEQLLSFGGTLGLLFVVAVAARVALGTVRRTRPCLQQKVSRWIHRAGPAASSEKPDVDPLPYWFLLFERYAAATIVLTAIWAAGHILGIDNLVEPVVGFLLRVMTILVLSRLLTLAYRALSRPVAELGDRHLSKTCFLHYWEHLTRLIPLGERCFEAAVSISAATLCVRELHFIDAVADFGPRVVQCIGIFFATRVLVELLHVLLHEAFGLYKNEPATGQRGQTLVPLLQSVCQYALYFGAAVMILGKLGVDTKPILAGAGILGLAVGLGAQSLVTDVVSGLFILFESQYFVGDYVEVGDAKGIVEAVAVRHTQIRDDQGKVHIIPNGQIKGVVNYSKHYVNAVVELSVPTGTDLEAVFRALREAGRVLRQTHKEVLAETVIQGIVELSLSDMTIRAVTRVRPGKHFLMQNEYRRILKELLEQTSLLNRNLRAA